MAVQYWVGDFFVDLSRNQVTQKEQSQTIAPKALAVLTYLAENKGRVVSYDELFDKVWPDTVVTPNTLQRSIAQLRKVLGADHKLQSYIKTHAKQGYSLECDVRWHDEANTQSLVKQEPLLTTNATTSIATDTNTDTEYSKPETKQENVSSRVEIENPSPVKTPWSALRLISIFVGIVLLGVIGFNTLTPEQPFKLNVGELRSLTTTDNKEFGAIYSPDGEYIVFLRYSEKLCIESNIWAKNIKTQKETQLTKNMARYDSHSFSKDGKTLVFIKTEKCSQPITQKNCYKLMTLDFDKALRAPQSPNLLMECKNSRITKAKGLNNNKVSLIQDLSNRW
jgi:DNA-binding winged helix-turn-helix (wHTH) protein